MAQARGRPGKRQRSYRDASPEETIKQCEQHLRTPVTDWDDIYLRLKASPLGTDFNRDQFLRTPIAVIRRVLDRIASIEQEKANAYSVSTARLTSVLINIAHGFSGSKSKAPKIDVKDFLPYPDWAPEAQETEGPSETTIHILVNLVKRNAIPRHVFVSLRTPLSR